MRIRTAATLAVVIACTALVPVAPSRAQGTGAQETADEAGRVVATEAAQLLALGAFRTPNDRLAGLIEPLGLAPAPSVAALIEVDDAGAVSLATLRVQTPNLSADARQALEVLDEQDRAAAGNASPISLGSESYLRALDHLRLGAGSAPRTARPPDIAAIAAWLNTLDFDAPLGPVPPPTTAPSPPTTGAPNTEPAEEEPLTSPPPVAPPEKPEPDASSDGDGLPVAILAIVALAAALLVTVAVLLRRRSAAASATEMGEGVDRLLEVSRRLTAAPAEEVDRSIVREAIGLVAADGGALIRRRAGTLQLGHESHSGLIIPDGLDHGTLARVAETGQSLVWVSNDEPAISSRPAALACVPLVGAGRIEAVVMVTRPSDQPFSAADARHLDAMAPVAAATLHRSQTAQAAIDQSLRDGLTGAGNRRRFDLELGASLDEGATLGATTALAIVDLDHFKAVNDAHGHQAGDAVLVQVVEVMRASIRPQDSVYRFGGEEFCILMAATDVSLAAQVAERVRAALEACRFTGSTAGELTQTASFGVSATTDTDAKALVARADAALYEAKGQGRNRVVASP